MLTELKMWLEYNDDPVAKLKGLQSNLAQDQDIESGELRGKIEAAILEMKKMKQK